MNVPKLRFKEFNDEYNITKLNKIIDVIDGDRGNNYPKKNDFYENEFCLFLNAGNVTKNGFSFKSNQFITKEKDKKLRNGKLLINDIVLTTRGTVGNVAWFNQKTLYKNIRINSGMVINRIKNSSFLLPEYLYSYMSSPIFKSQVNKMNYGSAQPQLTVSGINNFNIQYPSINEQKKISTIMLLLDKKIELQSKKIEGLKLFKLYSENKLLNSNDSIYWKKIKLNDILIEGNKEPVKNTNNFKKITIKLNLNGLEFNESKRETSDRRPFYIREENEIIIGKQNYFNGSIAIVTKKFSGCICSNAIMSFKVKEGYNLKYIYLYLSQKRYMKEREFLANGTGQKELSEKEFLKFTIKVPEDSVVKKITNIIEKINKKINFENNKLNKLIELKKGLMQNMFV